MLEILLPVEHIFSFGKLLCEAGEIVICPLAEYEEGDDVIGVYFLVDAEDARYHLLEDEHVGIPAREVPLLQLLNGLLDAGLLFALGTQGL